MNGETDYEALDTALRQAGSSWNAAQAHGLMTARLAILGAGADTGIVAPLFDGAVPGEAERSAAEALLAAELNATRRALAERLSEFSPLLPDDGDPAERRTAAIAHWSEGFLHGLVASGERQSAVLRERLAAEPVADIIKDMLELTRATADEGEWQEEEEQAYAEVVEYLRVAAQLVYEELADTRPRIDP